MQSYWIWLSERNGISLQRKHALLEQLGDPRKLYEASQTLLAGLGMKDKELAALLDKDLSGAEEIQKACVRKGAGVLCWADEAYPEALRQIPDAPLVLYYMGRLPDFNNLVSIGVVGTRKATAYGLSTARRIAGQIGACGAIVVSGMAFGIDAMAAWGALDAGATVVGVLGCGIDKIYPAANRALYYRVREEGCLLSEYAPGVGPRSWYFPARNRIISGLSRGVLVVEAPEKSGALITANAALEQNRDVFAVPGNVDMASCTGSNALLKSGAYMAQCGWDVVEHYAGQYPHQLSRAEYVPQEKPDFSQMQVAQNPQTPEAFPEKSIDKEVCPLYSGVDKIPELTPEEQAVVAVLRRGADLVDNVIAAAGVCPGNALAVMTMLQVKGIVQPLPGKRVALK